MTPQHLIPLSDAVKAKADVIAVPTGLLAMFSAIPWAEVAGFLSCIYLGLRIIELVAGWIKKKK